MPPSDSVLGNRVHSGKDGEDGTVHIKFTGNASSAAVAATAEFQVMVDDDGNAHVLINGHNPAGDKVATRLAENGSVVIDGVYDAGNNSDPGNTGLVGMARNTSPADSQQTLRISAIANGDGSVRSLDIALHDEDGEPYTATNPMPVTLEASEGLEVHDPDTAEDVAKLATENHDYIIAANKTLKLSQVIVDASGDGQWDLQIGDGVTPTEGFTRLMRTWSSAAKRGDMSFVKAFEIAAGGDPKTLRLIKKNIDNSSQDLESLFIGVLF